MAKVELPCLGLVVARTEHYGRGPGYEGRRRVTWVEIAEGDAPQAQTWPVRVDAETFTRLQLDRWYWIDQSGPLILFSAAEEANHGAAQPVQQ